MKPGLGRSVVTWSSTDVWRGEQREVVRSQGAERGKRGRIPRIKREQS